MNKIKAIFNKRKTAVQSDVPECGKDVDIEQQEVTHSLVEDINMDARHPAPATTPAPTSAPNTEFANVQMKRDVDMGLEHHVHMAGPHNELIGAIGVGGVEKESPQASSSYISHSSSLGSAMTDSCDESIDSEDSKETSDDKSDGIPQFIEQHELKGFKLLAKIGEGAFSKVYCARPDSNGGSSFLTENYQRVAVKVIKKEALVDPNDRTTKRQENDKIKTSSRDQVLKEVTIHKTVSSGCKHIVGFIDFQESKHYYYIVQELLNGGEIFGEIVKYTYFSEDLCRHVIRQVALAVKHMHQLGVVHRDIKPENLLFETIEYIPSKQVKLRKSDDPATKKDEGLFIPNVGSGGIGVVKLADFGLSKQIFALNTKTPCGTVGYTAPEVVKDERYSMKVDMWGLGCVLYTMLCGFPPFYDEKIDVLTEKISRGEYTFLRPWWDEISDGAKQAVRRLLEVDPAKRYDVNEFLADPWLNSYDACVEIETTKRHMKHRKSRAQKRIAAQGLHDYNLLYSPAAVAMRDAFDISNAVQRIEEDKRSRSLILGALAEEEEDERTNRNQSGVAAVVQQHYDVGVGTSPGQEVQQLDQRMFQLRLKSSTIIKRRQKNHGAPPNTLQVIPEPAEQAGQA